MTSRGLALTGNHTLASSEPLERYFTTFLYVFLALTLTRFSPLEPRLAASLDVGMRGDLIKQAGYIGLFFGALLPALSNPPRLVAAIPAAFLFFFAWCALTLLWSPVPDIATRRLILTFIIVATLFIVTANLRPQRAIFVTSNTLNALVLASIIACLLMPSLAVHQPGDPESGIIGDWRGLFYHKNIFGSVAAISALLNIHLALQRRRIIYWLLFAICVAALWMSGSKTSLGVGALAAAVMLVWMRAERSHYRQVWVKLALAAAPPVFGVCVWWISGPGLSLLSDPELLTGRARIWQMMSHLIAQHPFGGVGYQSVFQTGTDGVMTDLTANPFFQTLAHAHNGYVETAVSTGLIGLILLIWALTDATIRPLWHRPANAQPIALVLLAIVIFGMLHALTESGLADRDRPVWVILVLSLGILRTMGQGIVNLRSKQ